MSTKIVLSDLIHTPIRYVLSKFLHKGKTYFKQRRQFDLDQTTPSFSNPIEPQSLKRILDADKLISHSNSDDLTGWIVEQYKAHRFNVLGSGWIDAGYGKPVVGIHGVRFNFGLPVEPDTEGTWLESVVNSANLTYSMELWQYLKSMAPDYEPINWFRDYKSGYEMEVRTWYTLAAKGLPRGVDVKVPWEVGRLQHLPLMALEALAKHENSEQLITEIKAQLLDFTLSNPPRWGVQWTSAMDVGIRVVNILLTLDLIASSQPKMLDDRFSQIMVGVILDHGRHLMDNLEHKEGLANNHYLANLCGLLFCGAYLPEGQETTKWSEYAGRELIREIKRQFLADGGGFESSVPYHFLSSELVTYAIAMLLRTGGEVDEEVQLKLWRANRLMKDLIRRDGSIPQFGDNDSGRLMKLSVRGEMITAKQAEQRYANLKGYASIYPGDEKYFDTNELDYRPVIHASDALLNAPHSGDTLENALVRELSGGKLLTPVNPGRKKQGLTESKVSELKILQEAVVYRHNGIEGLDEGLEAVYYPDFGVYVLKGKRMQLVVNGMNCHVRQYWNHGHNDKLSFDLVVDDQPICLDPGSYVYTAFPDMRNEYRSTRAHNAVRFGDVEQNYWLEGKPGTFRMVARSKVKLLAINSHLVRCAVTYGKYRHVREIEVKANKIVVRDKSNFKCTQEFFPEISHSNGYGKQLNRQK